MSVNKLGLDPSLPYSQEDLKTSFLNCMQIEILNTSR